MIYKFNFSEICTLHINYFWYFGLILQEEMSPMKLINADLIYLMTTINIKKGFSATKTKIRNNLK